MGLFAAIPAVIAQTICRSVEGLMKRFGLSDEVTSILHRSARPSRSEQTSTVMATDANPCQRSIVPYIDVMLVLLVIFMATAPLLTQGVNVDLPDAPSAAITTLKAIPGGIHARGWR